MSQVSWRWATPDTVSLCICNQPPPRTQCPRPPRHWTLAVTPPVCWLGCPGVADQPLGLREALPPWGKQQQGSLSPTPPCHLPTVAPVGHVWKLMPQATVVKGGGVE